MKETFRGLAAVAATTGVLLSGCTVPASHDELNTSEYTQIVIDTDANNAKVLKAKAQECLAKMVGNTIEFGRNQSNSTTLKSYELKNGTQVTVVTDTRDNKSPIVNFRSQVNPNTIAVPQSLTFEVPDVTAETAPALIDNVAANGVVVSWTNANGVSAGIWGSSLLIPKNNPNQGFENVTKAMC